MHCINSRLTCLLAYSDFATSRFMWFVCRVWNVCRWQGQFDIRVECCQFGGIHLVLRAVVKWFFRLDVQPNCVSVILTSRWSSAWILFDSCMCHLGHWPGYVYLDLSCFGGHTRIVRWFHVSLKQWNTDCNLLAVYCLSCWQLLCTGLVFRLLMLLLSLFIVCESLAVFNRHAVCCTAVGSNVCACF